MTKQSILSTQNCGTGFFASAQRYTKTHITHFVNGKAKPLCGCKIGKDMSYQWASSTIWREYIECQNCLKILEKYRQKENP